MAAPEKAPPPPVVQDFPPSRPGVKFFGIIAIVVAAIVFLVFRQQVMAAVGLS